MKTSSSPCWRVRKAVTCRPTIHRGATIRSSIRKSIRKTAALKAPDPDPALALTAARTSLVPALDHDSEIARELETVPRLARAIYQVALQCVLSNHQPKPVVLRRRNSKRQRV